MKILIVTNLYPPHYLGGYELRCAEVAEALQQAGHAILVLTTVYGLPLDRRGGIRVVEEQIRGVRVLRYLNQYVFPGQPVRRPWTYFRAQRELHDARVFRRILRDFRPDIVTWWSAYGVAKMLLPLPHRLGIPDVHWVEHWWMIEEYELLGGKTAAFWRAFWDGKWGPTWARWPLRVLGRMWETRVRREGLPTRSFPLQPCHVTFVSEFMRRLHREAGLDFPSSEVIYGGVPSERFVASVSHGLEASSPLRVLYAGQLTPDRGLLTAVEAFARLRADVRSRLTLSVAGDGSPPYPRQVAEKVRALGLEERVFFLGKVPYEEMPMLFRRHEVLVFPSLRAEGLPLTMVEAMLAGCAVVTTGSGGAEEVANLAGLPRFGKNDSIALAQILERLADDRAELSAVAKRGQQVAMREFNFARMLDRWTATIERVAADGKSRTRQAKRGCADGPEGLTTRTDQEPAR